MNVNIQTVRFDADARLVEYINRKLEKLNTFHDRIIQVNVFLKLDNVVHTIKDKIAEIRVHVPRHDFFVKSTSKSFEESFDDAFNTLVNQIKRKKAKNKPPKKNYKTLRGLFYFLIFRIKFPLKIFAISKFPYLCLPKIWG